jgi:hypothetical protein
MHLSAQMKFYAVHLSAQMKRLTFRKADMNDTAAGIELNSPRGSSSLLQQTRTVCRPV